MLKINLIGGIEFADFFCPSSLEFFLFLDQGHHFRLQLFDSKLELFDVRFRVVHLHLHRDIDRGNFGEFLKLLISKIYNISFLVKSLELLIICRTNDFIEISLKAEYLPAHSGRRSEAILLETHCLAPGFKNNEYQI